MIDMAGIWIRHAEALESAARASYSLTGKTNERMKAKAAACREAAYRLNTKGWKVANEH